jgi:hypothetical protein
MALVSFATPPFCGFWALTWVVPPKSKEKTTSAEIEILTNLRVNMYSSYNVE